MNNLHEIAKKLEKMYSESSKLAWVHSTTGYDYGVGEINNQITNFLKDKSNFQVICSLKEKDLDFKDKRRVEIMYDIFKPYHMSDELNVLEEQISTLTRKLSKVFHSNRYIFEGKVTPLEDLAVILSTDEDRNRRKEAFLARNQINKKLVDAGFIDLINLRKEYAIKAGYEDFVDMRLKEQGLDKSIFEGWKEQLQSMIPKMDESKADYAKTYLNDTEVMPWDQMYIQSKLGACLNKKVDMYDFYSVLHKFFNKFGIDISEYNITYDVFSRDNKNEWSGLYYPIKPGVDSRILANVKNRFINYRVLIHETGHVIHASLLNPEETILNYGVSEIIDEGVATIFHEFFYQEIFYKDVLGDDEEIKNQLSRLKTYQNISPLSGILLILFEQALYLNDINSLEDINALYLKYYKELFGKEPYSDNPPWGAKIHYIGHPIYLHSYLMGDVTREMITQVFKEKYYVNDISEKPQEFAEFLYEEVIKASGLYKFTDLFERISGKKFSLDYISKV